MHPLRCAFLQPPLRLCSPSSASPLLKGRMAVSTRSPSLPLRVNLRVRIWLLLHNVFHFPFPRYPSEHRPQDLRQRQTYCQRQAEKSCYDRAEINLFATVDLVRPISFQSICLELTHLGYCCLESGENTKCVELGASICASPFTPAAGFISQGTGEVVTLPTATSTLRMEGLGPVLTQSARIKDRSSTSQRSTVSQDDALGKGGSAPSVTSSGPGGQPIETFATASILTEPTCDDGGCCTFPPSWTARQGGYLTKMNEDILTSTQTPSSEPSGEKLFQTILGLDDSKHATWMFSTSTSKNRAGETFVVVQPVVILNQKAGTDRERLDFSTMTSIRPFPTPSHYRISLDGQCGTVADTTCDGSYFGYCCGPDSR